jgi:hypothetical protein
MWFLRDHHCASVVDNRDITPAQIQSDERLRFNNHISYMQAYRVKQALLIEIEGHEADCFARFPVYLQHMADTDDGSQGRLSYDEETGLNFDILYIKSILIEYRLFRSCCFRAVCYNQCLLEYQKFCCVRCMLYKVKVSNNAYDCCWN